MYKNHNRITIITLFAIVAGAAFILQSNEPASATIVRPTPAQFGQASWYSKRSPGIRKRTANNEVFDDLALTAAMWGVPFHQKVRVTNVNNGKSIIVRINDRGPHKRLKGRVIDLTKRAFALLGSTKKGLIKVKVELL